MMDTILNLGLNEETLQGIATASGNPRFALDSLRRFVMMFADVVLGVSKHDFDNLFREYKAQKGYKLDTEMTAEDLKHVSKVFLDLVKTTIGKDFPTNPR